jgi:nucleotide-binding universal stress UspA family protein
MKLLVTTDFSQPSSMIEAVKSRPWSADTELRVLHVIDPARFETNSELLETARQGADSAAQSLARDLERAGLKTQAEVLVGHPRRAIVEFARQWGANFIAVGSHGANAVARFFLGSVTQSVVRWAPCSVLVVRPGAVGSAAAGWKVLLATDGSDGARVAARSIVERPWPTGTVVRITSVAAPFMPLTDAGMVYFDPGQSAEVAQEVEADERSVAAEAVAQAKGILAGSSALKVEETEPVIGDPKRVVVEQASAWGATTVVVGSHGRHSLDRFLTGSVSEFVAMYAPCSVEVIR